MRFLCVIKHTIYGETDTELMPPVKNTETYVGMSKKAETKEAFCSRVSKLVLPLRKNAELRGARPYSTVDGWDWSIFDIKPISALPSQ